MIQPPPTLCQNCQLYEFTTLVEAFVALLQARVWEGGRWRHFRLRACHRVVCMQLTVGNNWNTILYPLIDATSWWTACYFIVYRVRLAGTREGGKSRLQCTIKHLRTSPPPPTPHPLPQFTMTDAVVSLIEAVMIEAFQAAQLSKEGEKADTGRLAEAVRRESISRGHAPLMSPLAPSPGLPGGGLLERLQAELFADVAAAEAQDEDGGGPNADVLAGLDSLLDGESGQGGASARVVVGIPRSELALLAKALRGHERSLERRQAGSALLSVPVPAPAPVPASSVARAMEMTEMTPRAAASAGNVSARLGNIQEEVGGAPPSGTLAHVQQWA